VCSVALSQRRTCVGRLCTCVCTYMYIVWLFVCVFTHMYERVVNTLFILGGMAKKWRVQRLHHHRLICGKRDLREKSVALKQGAQQDWKSTWAQSFPLDRAGPTFQSRHPPCLQLVKYLRDFSKVRPIVNLLYITWSSKMREEFSMKPVVSIPGTFEILYQRRLTPAARHRAAPI